MLDKPVLNVWGGALLGARSDQQDTFLTEPLPASGGLLAIVADGMGGHASGALASQTAASAFRNAFFTLQTGTETLDAVFNGAVHAANDAIQDMQAGHPERHGMGTTLVAVHMTAQGLSWISVGDSALLLCRDNQLYRLNEDHSLRGLPEFANSKQSNMLRSALTGDDIALIDCQAEPLVLLDGDIVLLASDGLLTLTSPEIAAEVWAPGAEMPDALGPNLLRAVEGKGDPKQDNCTVIVLAAPVSPLAAEAPPRPDKTVVPDKTIVPERPLLPVQKRVTEQASLTPQAEAAKAVTVAPPPMAPKASLFKPVAILLLVGAVLIAAALLALYW